MPQTSGTQHKPAGAKPTIENVFKKVTHIEQTVNVSKKKMMPQTAKHKKAEERGKKLASMTKEERDVFLKEDYNNSTAAEKAQIDKRRDKNATYRLKKAHKALKKARERNEDSKEELVDAEDKAEAAAEALSEVKTEDRKSVV